MDSSTQMWLNLIPTGKLSTKSYMPAWKGAWLVARFYRALLKSYSSAVTSMCGPQRPFHLFKVFLPADERAQCHADGGPHPRASSWWCSHQSPPWLKLPSCLCFDMDHHGEFKRSSGNGGVTPGDQWCWRIPAPCKFIIQVMQRCSWKRCPGTPREGCSFPSTKGS